MPHRYCVEIKETLNRQLIVQAESEIEAIRKIKDGYYAGDIILGGDDCMGVVFTAELHEKRETCK